jgi:hypothetical protein
MSEDTKGREPWHIKREIQLGHLITTITVAVSVIVYVSKLEQRIALVEQQHQVQRDRDAQQDQATREAMATLRQQLDRMDTKLDRLIERERKHP